MSTERAVETLLGADPEFQRLCEVLYGPDVDSDVVWDDVFGVAKADSSDHDKTLKRVGLAATLIGAGLGVKELGEGVAQTKGPIGRGVHSLIEGAKTRTPGAVKTVLKKPSFKIGAAGAMLGGDLAATHGLKSSEQPKTPVLKAAPTVKALAVGVKQGWKAAEKQAANLSNIGPKLPSGNTTGATVGAALRKPTTLVRAHPVASVAGASALAVGADRHHRNKAMNYDDVYKADSSFDAEGTFTKFDTDKRLAFGWASVTKKDGVDIVDRQGDYMTIEDVEDAAYRYVISSRVGGDMHKRNGAVAHHISDMVESFVVTPEKIAKMGLPENTPQGWWVGFKINDDTAWEEVKVGKKVGFSIHGHGKRADHELQGY